MNPPFYRQNRAMFYLKSCPHCAKVLSLVADINIKLPVEKRIKLVECSRYQHNGEITDHLLLLYGDKFDGFPTIFLGTLKINGSNSKIESEAYLNALLQDEFIIPEYSDKRFSLDCEFSKKGGLFKNKVICK